MHSELWKKTKEEGVGSDKEVALYLWHEAFVVAVDQSKAKSIWESHVPLQTVREYFMAVSPWVEAQWGFEREAKWQPIVPENVT